MTPPDDAAAEQTNAKETASPPQGDADAQESTQIQVSVTSDKLQALLKICPPAEGPNPSLADARTALESAGVCHGIDDDLLKAIFEDDMFDEQHLVAHGDAPHDGIDGSLKFLVKLKHNLTPSVDAKGNADYKKVDLFTNVEKGTKLVEIVPPVPGVTGKNVLGEEVEPHSGAPINMRLGPNVEYDKNNSNLIISMIDGNASLQKENTLTVDPVFIVKENVDFHTGNIEFKGSVIIMGDVKSDFSVRAVGDIQVGGVVEDAQLYAGGNILLKQGCVGKQKGHIEAKGTITAKYANNHKFIAGGNITVGETLLHTIAQTDEKIILSGKRGSIIGGETIARNGISVKTLGSAAFPITAIIVGINQELKEKIDDINAALKNNETNALEVAKHLQRLNRERKSRGTLPPQKMSLFKKMERMQEHLKLEKKELPEDRAKLEAELEQYANVKVKVMNDVYPNVTITILNAKMKIRDSVSHCQFELEDGDVRAVKWTKGD